MAVKKNRTNPFALARKSVALKKKVLTTTRNAAQPDIRDDLEKLIFQLRETVKNKVIDDMAKSKKMNVSVFSDGWYVDKKGFFTKNEKEKIIFVGSNKKRQIEIVTMVPISFPPRLQGTEIRRVALALGYKQKKSKPYKFSSKAKTSKEWFDDALYCKKGSGFQMKFMDGDNKSSIGFALSIYLSPAHLKKIFKKTIGKEEIKTIESCLQSVLKSDCVS